MRRDSRPRIVSLVPSFTETLRAWDLDPVACSRFCEQPDLATVGGTKNPDIEAIVGLDPDLVLLDREENRREDAEALTARGVELFVSDVRDLDDVEPTLSRLADAIHLDVEPELLGRTEPTVVDRSRRLRVFVPIWRRPWMTIGVHTYGASLLAALGADSVVTGDGYPEVTLDQVAELAPDLVLAPSEPYTFEAAHLDELAEVATVLEVDGQDLFWWGVRTPAALRRLGSVLEAVRSR